MPWSGGTELLGRIPRLRPWEAQALSALARQLTPQADERGCVLRVPVLRSVFFSLAIVATSATPALATSTGGVAAGGSTQEPVPRRRAKAINLLHAAPVVSRSANLAYSGPVFEKTATGEVVPYLPSTPTGQASGPTGGSPVGVAANVKPDLLVPGSRARYVGGLAAAPMS